MMESNLVLKDCPFSFEEWNVIELIKTGSHNNLVPENTAHLLWVLLLVSMGYLVCLQQKLFYCTSWHLIMTSQGERCISPGKKSPLNMNWWSPLAKQSCGCLHVQWKQSHWWDGLGCDPICAAIKPFPQCITMRREGEAIRSSDLTSDLFLGQTANYLKHSLFFPFAYCYRIKPLTWSCATFLTGGNLSFLKALYFSITAITVSHNMIFTDLRCKKESGSPFRSLRDSHICGKRDHYIRFTLLIKSQMLWERHAT